MYCRKCGTYLNDGTQICPTCGCEIIQQTASNAASIAAASHTPELDAAAAASYMNQLRPLSVNTEYSRTSDRYGAQVRKKHSRALILTILGSLIVLAALVAALVITHISNGSATGNVVNGLAVAGTKDGVVYSIVREDATFRIRSSTPEGTKTQTIATFATGGVADRFVIAKDYLVYRRVDPTSNALHWSLWSMPIEGGMPMELQADAYAVGVAGSKVYTLMYKDKVCSLWSIESNGSNESYLFDLADDIPTYAFVDSGALYHTVERDGVTYVIRTRLADGSRTQLYTLSGSISYPCRYAGALWWICNENGTWSVLRLEDGAAQATSVYTATSPGEEIHALNVDADYAVFSIADANGNTRIAAVPTQGGAVQTLASSAHDVWGIGIYHDQVLFFDGGLRGVAIEGGETRSYA